MSFYNNFKSILFKTKYYPISYKLNFILNSNLFKIIKFKSTRNIPFTIYQNRVFLWEQSNVTFYNKFILNKIKTKGNYTTYYYNYLKIHRDNKPAIIGYFENNTIECEIYYCNGVQYRDNGPTYIEYKRNGSVKYINNKNGH